MEAAMRSDQSWSRVEEVVAEVVPEFAEDPSLRGRPGRSRLRVPVRVRLLIDGYLRRGDRVGLFARSSDASRCLLAAREGAAPGRDGAVRAAGHSSLQIVGDLGRACAIAARRETALPIR